MHSNFLALLALSPIALALSRVGRADELVNCLESSLSPQGSVISPDDSSFANDINRFSTYHNPTFRLVSLVTNEDDVRASINCAKKTGTPFLFTGPRHGTYMGFDKLKNGLEIFTSAFDNIEIDTQANTMTIGGAVVFKDISNALYAVGKNIPVGGGPCVGMVGASLGAGVGRLEGLYGLMIDSLLSVRIMLPNTTVIEASTQKNTDLFWGIRGAGFNFGFVLNATFRVYDEVPNGLNFNADFEFPLSVAESFYQALKDEAPTIPAPLCLSTSLSWSSTYNATTLAVNAVYAGPESDGREAVQFLQKLGPVLRQNSTEVPWNELTQNTFFLDGNEAIETCGLSYGRRSTMGALFNKIEVEAHVSMTEQFNYMVTKYPQMRSSDNGMYFCGTQAVRAVPRNATAYPWRQALGHHTWGFVYSDNTTDAEIEYLPEKIRATIADSAGTDGLAVYVGFSNGDEPLESLFSKENLPRLAALKKDYDPDGLFNAYHPLPTHYS
ncbi:hypothetical protein F5X99DRAFT_427578 [Biscogniauxia marginata]|nr:hypothetical protein F5X99DRAFT_427578 [Biscogniauxia marginata]